MEIIKQITNEIEKHKGVKLLDVDPGEATNRTVVTFVGSPEDVVETAAYFLRNFEENGIRVIKCGLHASEFVEQDMVGGFYHPAFRELCETSIYRKLIEEELGLAEGSVTIAAAPSCISKAIGHKKANLIYFKEQGIDLKIVGDDSLPKYKVKLRR